MDEESKKLLQDQRVQLQKIQEGVDKTRKYLLVSLIVSLTVFLLPLIAILIAAPIVLNMFTSSYGTLL